jgi:hypothetical protein
MTFIRQVDFKFVDRALASDQRKEPNPNLDDGNDIFWDRERGEVFNRYNNDRIKVAELGGGIAATTMTPAEYFRVCLHDTGEAMAQMLYLRMTGAV